MKGRFLAAVLLGAIAMGVAGTGGIGTAGATTGATTGVTVKGVTGGTFTSQSGDPSAKSGSGTPSPTKGDLFGVTISVPPVGPIPESNMGVLGGEDEKAECDGTFSKPTAPPGFLCVYLALDQAVNVYEGKDQNGIVVTGEGNAAAQANPIGSGRYGVQLTWYAAAPGPSTLVATWAYTSA